VKELHLIIDKTIGVRTEMKLNDPRAKVTDVYKPLIKFLLSKKDLKTNMSFFSNPFSLT
jgi:hypothetical protein